MTDKLEKKLKQLKKVELLKIIRQLEAENQQLAAEKENISSFLSDKQQKVHKALLSLEQLTVTQLNNELKKVTDMEKSLEQLIASSSTIKDKIQGILFS